ncbi:MAG: hypothetical protein V1809_08455 [Planctomycetota bacterium]
MKTCRASAVVPFLLFALALPGLGAEETGGLDELKQKAGDRLRQMESTETYRKLEDQFRQDIRRDVEKPLFTMRKQRKFYEMVSIQFNLQDFAEALRSCKDTEKFSPVDNWIMTSGELARRTARVYIMLGRPDDAAARLEQAKELVGNTPPRNQAWIRREIASIEKLNAEAPAFKNTFLEIQTKIQEAPESPKGWWERADLCQDRYPLLLDAATALLLLREKFPDFAQVTSGEVLLRLTEVHRRFGLHERALKFVDEFFAKDSPHGSMKSGDAYRVRAEVRERVGENLQDSKMVQLALQDYERIQNNFKDHWLVKNEDQPIIERIENCKAKIKQLSPKHR